MVHGIQCFSDPYQRGTDGEQARPTDDLLLHTIGRKSGQPRVVPIAYFRQDGSYLLAGANWGKHHHADWYLNLMKQPRAIIQVNGTDISVNAHDAQGDDYARFWKIVTERRPPYSDYQKTTARLIPIVVLQRRKA